MYNTVCQNCHRRSERDSDFLEIEVNLEVSPAPYPAAWEEPNVIILEQRHSGGTPVSTPGARDTLR